MYTDEDLSLAVERGVFSESSVRQFRVLMAGEQQSPLVDEENLRLVSSFNDIFVATASTLLLISAFWVLQNHVPIGVGVVAVVGLSWGLAEFFVHRRKMAFSAIVLLLAFMIGIFRMCNVLLSSDHSFWVDLGLGGDFHFLNVLLYSGAAFIGIGLYWWRFRVPIAFAACVAMLVSFVLANIFLFFDGLHNYSKVFVFISGLAVFCYALYWDAADIRRTTRKSDVAFWLHLLSAPLIVHPVFSSVVSAGGSLSGLLFTIALYIVIVLLSLVIDRRAFMISSLAYVIASIAFVIKDYSDLRYDFDNFSFGGIVVGGALLLLSACWHWTRAMLVVRLPDRITKYIPAIRET